MISQFIFNKFTVFKKINKKLILFKSNIDFLQLISINKFHSKKKILQIFKKNNQSFSIFNEEKNAIFLKKEKTFKKFLVNYFSWFEKKFYWLIIDEKYVIKHSDSDDLKAAKLLKLSFLWIMTAIFLLNKIWNFYDYAYLMYNVDWNLNLLSEFLTLLMLKKFKNAKHYYEILELFNSVNIRWLVINNHINASIMMIAIFILFWNCMIRRIQNIIINEKKIDKLMSKKHFNTVIFIFNKIKQFEYCCFHQKHTATFLKQSNFTKHDDTENDMNAHRMKIFF